MLIKPPLGYSASGTVHEMEKMKMNLNDADIKRFYNIWFSLLDYTNSKYEIAPEIRDLVHSSNINPEDISPIRDRLWQDNTILEEVVSANPLQFPKRIYPS